MTLSGRSIYSVVPLEEGRPMVYLRGAGLGEVAPMPWMFTSYGEIDASMDDVQTHVSSLKADITSHMTPGDLMATDVGRRFYSDWVQFFAEWNTFYQTNRHGVRGTALAASGALQSALRRLAGRFNGLESRYHALGYDITPVGAPPETQNALSTEAWVGIGIGAGVLALGFIAWGLHSVSSVAAPIARRSSEGRRRR